MSKTLSECLELAADLIEEKGWGRGSFSQPVFGPTQNGRYYVIDEQNFCMMGALKKVCQETSLQTFAETFSYSAPQQLYHYNDRNATKDRVINRLRKTAKKLAKKGR